MWLAISLIVTYFLPSLIFKNTTTWVIFIATDLIALVIGIYFFKKSIRTLQILLPLLFLANVVLVSYFTFLVLLALSING